MKNSQKMSKNIQYISTKNFKLDLIKNAKKMSKKIRQNFHKPYEQYAFAEIVILLKKQGFYRRQYRGQKLTEKQEQAPLIKWKYRKDEL